MSVAIGRRARIERDSLMALGAATAPSCIRVC